MHYISSSQNTYWNRLYEFAQYRTRQLYRIMVSQIYHIAIPLSQFIALLPFYYVYDITAR